MNPTLDIAAIRAAQAEAILSAIEALPAGTSVRLYNSPSQGWTAMYNGRVCFGDSPTDALGQILTVVALEEAS